MRDLFWLWTRPGRLWIRISRTTNLASPASMIGG